MIKKNEMATAKTYVQKVLEQSAYQPNQTDEEKRQILCAFCFGVLNGFLMERKIEMPQFHALMLHTLNDQMGYSLDQSMQAYDYYVGILSAGKPSVPRSIIHRGLEGYYQIQSGDVRQLRANIEEIFMLIAQEAHR